MGREGRAEIAISFRLGDLGAGDRAPGRSRHLVGGARERDREKLERARFGASRHSRGSTPSFVCNGAEWGEDRGT